MIKEWFNWINITVAIAAALLLLAGAFVMLSSSAPIPVLDVAATKSTLPECSFKQPKEAYAAIDEPVFHLKKGTISLQLPDLKNVLSYHGKNGRPDADSAHTMLHLGIAGEKALSYFLPNDRIYMYFDRKLVPPRYAFSPNNSETPLWIEVSPNGNQLSVKVNLKDENGTIINEPIANARFTLTEKPVAGAAATPWEINNMRVDGTLLARQKTRWFGSDRFLERHGGTEYQHIVGKQRVDFGEGEDAYSVFVGKDSILVWNGSRWKITSPGEETLGKPILVVKKIDEKLMNFELWDPEGKNKVVLNLLKSSEAAIPTNLMSSFHFLGAKTLSQFVFEVNKERMTLSPQDWLLFIDKGWHKLSSPEEIDDYVDRKTLGYLFVFDAVERRDDRQIMIGTLFNRARTDMQPVELVMQQSGTGMVPPTQNRFDEGSKYREPPAGAPEQPKNDNQGGTPEGFISSDDSKRASKEKKNRHRQNKAQYDDDE